VRSRSQVGRGRRSALAGMPTKERQSLRQYLREQVDPAEVWTALKAALESGSQTAVVSAARLLVTELYEDRAEEDEAKLRQQAGAEARQRLAELLETRARPREHKVRELIGEMADTLLAEAVEQHPEPIVGDVPAERAATIFEGLEELGWLVRRHRVEELAEQLAQERLAVLKQEHGIPA
jgi:hypothetical protein